MIASAIVKANVDRLLNEVPEHMAQEFHLFVGGRL